MTIATTSANGITIAYETFGDRSDPPVVLIMGLGVQLLAWPEEFCRELAGRGYFVVRFDNRDVGQSTHFPDAPEPDFAALLTTGDTSSAAYHLDDMAADTVGLMDALDLERAHVVGASMGGMIAQCVAIGWPERVRSLTSIMSTPSLADGPPTEKAAAALLMAPPTNREEAGAQAVAGFAIIGSPGFPPDEDELRAVAMASFDRDPDRSGVGRQFMAIAVAADRKEALGRVRVPTLVVHGADDPLVQPSGGEATARAVPGAELLVFEGMGHDLPKALWGPIIDAVTALAARADASG